MNKNQKIIHPKIKRVDYLVVFNKRKILNNNLEKLNNMLQAMNAREIVYILGSKKEIILRNLYAGIFRGIGVGIGVTLISAAIIKILQNIVTLNIPVIGEYVSDIVDIVQKSK